MTAAFGGLGSALTEAARVGVLLGAGLLAPAGVAKLRRPGDAGDALGWRSRGSRTAVRLIGLGELLLAASVIAASVLAVGGRPLAGLLAATYLVFAGVALRQRQRGASCGCFGTASAPASLLHVVIDLIIAAAALASAVSSAGLGRPVALGAAPGLSLATVLLLVVAVATVQQLLTGLPDLQSATRRVTLPAPRSPRRDPAPGGVR